MTVDERFNAALGEAFANDPANAVRAHAAIQPVLAALRDEVSGLRAARMAYASEFPLNADGEPDVGSIHANIRALRDENERLRKDAERYEFLRNVAWNTRGETPCVHMTTKRGNAMEFGQLDGQELDDVIDALLPPADGGNGDA